MYKWDLKISAHQRRPAKSAAANLGEKWTITHNNYDEVDRCCQLKNIRKWANTSRRSGRRSGRRSARGSIFSKSVLISVAIVVMNIALTNSYGSDTNYKLIGEPILPIPPRTDVDKAKSLLGKRLFYDTNLSDQNILSCSSCHNPKTGGASRAKFSLNTSNQPVAVNTPTIFNSVFNRWQNWNGRISTFEEQIDDSITSPTLMNTNWETVVKKIKKNDSYVTEFGHEYDDDIKPEYIIDALIHYIKTLTTPNSRFDRYLLGEKDAITDDEKAGYEEFKSHGCIACHQGINIGGNVFEKFGIFGNYFKDSGEVDLYDKGRYNITGRQRDLYVFRVSSLRNIENTPPYFHDGSAKTLEQAVKIMSRYQLGSIPSDSEVNLIVKFLLTLTGDYKDTLQ